MTKAAIGAVLCLAVPLAMTWFSRRALQPDDPLLPQRLARANAAPLIGLILVALGGPLVSDLPWFLAVGLGAVGAVLGAWPSAGRLWGDEWGPVAHLKFHLRNLVGLQGFWLLLGMAPGIVLDPVWARLWGPPAALGVALVLAMVLTVWLFRWVPALWWILGARAVPLAEWPELEDIAARSRIDGLELYRMDATGGVSAQAFALPQATPPAVLFGGDLFERLTPAERAGVFAHEVGHLEQRDAAHLRWVTAGELVLVGLSSFALPWLLAGGPGLIWTLSWAWPFVVMGLLGAYQRSRRNFEADADARAAELCGGGEALAAALARLYELHALPRRFDRSTRDRLTHPDLPDRIRSLAGPADAPDSLEIEVDGQGLVLDQAGVTLFDGTEHRWEDLVDVVLGPTRKGAQLVVSTDGTTHTVPVQPDQVEKLQGWLDAVHERIGAEARPPVGGLVRLGSTAALLLAALQWAPAAAGLFAAWALLSERNRSAWAATAVALAGQLVLIALGWPGFDPIWVPAVIGSTAFVAWSVGREALRNDSRELSSREWTAVMVLVACVVYGPLASWVAFGGRLDRMHLVIRDVHSLVLGPLGLGAGLLLAGRWAAVIPGGALAAVGLAALWVGTVPQTPAQGELFVGVAPPIEVAGSVPQPVLDRPLYSDLGSISLSPDGHWIVGMQGDQWDDWEDGHTIFEILPTREGPSPGLVDASAVAFVGSELVGAVRVKRQTFAVGWDPARPNTPAWRVKLPRLERPQVAAGPNDSWVIDGDTRAGVVQVVGRGDQVDEVRRFPGPERGEHWDLADRRLLSWLEGDGRTAPVFFGADSLVFPDGEIQRWVWQDGEHMEQVGTSITWSSCTAAGDVLWCGVPARQTLFRWETGESRPRPVARARGQVWLERGLPDGRISGWVGDQLVLFDADGGGATVLAGPFDTCVQVDFAGDRLAILLGCLGEPLTLQVVELPAP